VPVDQGLLSCLAKPRQEAQNRLDLRDLTSYITTKQLNIKWCGIAIIMCRVNMGDLESNPELGAKEQATSTSLSALRPS